jgi:tRNA (guanine37-N1)-methyltransferase
MRFDIITIFPEMFTGFLETGLIRRARKKRLFEVNVHNLRDYAQGKHRQVDDRPFGGEEGMVFKPEPIFAAVEALRQSPDTPVFLLSPQGRTLSPSLASELAAHPQVILICGRYEGVDERVVEHLVQDEISIGDYVLSGGELAAMVVVDAASRFVPGVVGKAGSVAQDSFNQGLLDFPQYTRPRDFRGMKVPQVLLSGDHRQIARWRRRRALEKTRAKRPDLLEGAGLTADDRRLLEPSAPEPKEKETKGRKERKNP